MPEETQVVGFGANDQFSVQIDPSHYAERVSMRPLEHAVIGGPLGHFRVAARSGAVTGAAVAAGAPLFSFQWRDTKSFAVLTFLRARWIPTTVFTAFQELGLDLIHVTAFTVADSVGTALAPIPMRRSSMGATLVTDMRIAAATLLTAGTRTLDASAIAVGGGGVNVVNAAAATAYVNPESSADPFGFTFEANPSRGEYPLVMGRDEGFLVRNTVVFPAAGVATLLVTAAWAEVPSY